MRVTGVSLATGCASCALWAQANWTTTTAFSLRECEPAAVPWWQMPLFSLIVFLAVMLVTISGVRLRNAAILLGFVTVGVVGIGSLLWGGSLFIFSTAANDFYPRLGESGLLVIFSLALIPTTQSLMFFISLEIGRRATGWGRILYPAALLVVVPTVWTSAVALTTVALC